MFWIKCYNQNVKFLIQNLEHSRHAENITSPFLSGPLSISTSVQYKNKISYGRSMNSGMIMLLNSLPHPTASQYSQGNRACDQGPRVNLNPLPLLGTSKQENWLWPKHQSKGWHCEGMPGPARSHGCTTLKRQFGLFGTTGTFIYCRWESKWGQHLRKQVGIN